MIAHATGRRDLALSCLARAIRLRPGIAPFHNNLGTVLQSLGRHAEALACFERALSLAPRYPAALLNLGNSLQHLERWEESAACYRSAIALDAGLAEAHNNLGNVLLAAGLSGEAIASFEEAIRIRPEYATAYLNLGNALKQQGRLQQAAESCRKAIQLAPNFAEAYGNLGSLLVQFERYEEAEACCREALRRRPDLPEPWVVRAVVLQAQGRSRGAEAASRQALALRPGYAEAHNNLGNALQEQGAVEAAVERYREAIRLKPGLADAHYNFGNARRRQLRLHEAGACYREALRIDAGHGKAHWNLALTQLLLGDWENGWEEFEWRWKKKDTPPRLFPQPLWDGSPLGGRAVLLHAEQGLGDTIQFVRYAPLVQQAGAKVLLECPPKLIPLLRTAPGIDELVAAGSALPPFDVHLPLMSLPRIFRTTPASVPHKTPYLRVDPDFAGKWLQRLPADGSTRVGLIWAGNPKHAEDRQRSLTLDDFATLADIPGVAWFSLQYGPQACQASAPPRAFRITPLGGEIADFRDAAAAAATLDLVISADTSMAHLAGALARPVWVLLPFVPDWRWLTGREDSPWYPTARLFRQPRPGDWCAVMERVAQSMRAFVPRRPSEPPTAQTPVNRADMKPDG